MFFMSEVPLCVRARRAGTCQWESCLQRYLGHKKQLPPLVLLQGSTGARLVLLQGPTGARVLISEAPL